MSENKARGLLHVVLTCAVLAVAFAVIVFVVPFVHNMTFWACCIAIGVAIIVAVIANAWVVVSSHSARSSLYRVSLATISILYLIVVGIVSLIIIALAAVPLWLTVVIQVIMLAFCLLGFIGGSLGATMIENDEHITANNAAFIRDARMRVEAAMAVTAKPEEQRALKSLADELRFTDPMSSQATYVCDQQLSAQLMQIDAMLRADDTAGVVDACRQASDLIAQRAAICRSTKR